ncbi:hypothetical protein KAS31_01790 [Candidatus Parcubacteria bacterium]|nr:hypothetical protein [Candidatus Parcubacteria bacterium]
MKVIVRFLARRKDTPPNNLKTYSAINVKIFKEMNINSITILSKLVDKDNPPRNRKTIILNKILLFIWERKINISIAKNRKAVIGARKRNK